MTDGVCRVGGVEVHYAEHGKGLPLIALHGAGVDHRELESALEPALAERGGHRRVYVDLPGMGRTPAPEHLTSNDDVVDLLVRFVDELAAGGPFLLLGHSYGAYLARAVAAERVNRAVGLALLCPVGETSRDLPTDPVTRVEGDPHALLEPEQVPGFDDYFVVRTPATARRYRDADLPGTLLADETALGRVFTRWALRPRPEERARYPHPTLILTGRQDTSAGFAAASDLLAHYPRATAAVLDDAGHALPHERPALLAAFLDDWLERAGGQAESVGEGHPGLSQSRDSAGA